MIAQCAADVAQIPDMCDWTLLTGATSWSNLPVCTQGDVLKLGSGYKRDCGVVTAHDDCRWSTGGYVIHTDSARRLLEYSRHGFTDSLDMWAIYQHTV